MGDSPMTRSHLLIGVVALFSAIALAKEGHTDEPETGLALLNSQAAKLREKSREAHARNGHLSTTFSIRSVLPKLTNKRRRRKRRPRMKRWSKRQKNSASQRLEMMDFQI